MIRNPGFALSAVATLALGIGFSVAVFSFIDTALLRTLPYEKPEEILQIWGSNPARNVPFHNLRYSDVERWRQSSRSLAAIATGRPVAATFLPESAAGGSATQWYAWQVDHEYFPLLGIHFLAGRGFSPEDDQPGAPPVVVLSHALWQAHFRGDARLLGNAISLNGEAHTVIGVLPENFEFIGRRVELFLPLRAPRAPGPESNGLSVTVFGRLRHGQNLEAAQSELTSLGQRMMREDPTTLAGHPRLWLMRDWVVRDIRAYLIFLGIAALLVLAVACFNVANLILIRADGRRRETALRAALGAGRWRLVALGVAESLWLAAAGGLLGVGFAWALVKGGVALLPEALAFVGNSTINGQAVLCAVVLAVLAGVFCGAFPAIAASRQRGMATALRHSERGAAEAGAHNRVRSALVAAEIALSMVLLAAAALLVQSLVRLLDQGPGFVPDGVITARLSPPERYSLAQRRAYYESLLQRLSERPEVEAAAITSILPLTASNSGTGFIPEGRPFPERGQADIAWVRSVSEDYLRVMRVPLTQGRWIAATDNLEAPPVAVVNETLARRFWPGESAVGKRFTTNIPQGRPITWITIVGVAGDVRHSGMHQMPEPELYWSFRQPPVSSVSVVVRARGDAALLAPTLREVAAKTDRAVPAAQMRTLREVVDNSVATRRVSVWIAGLFAVVALLLAALGVFGMVSYAVSRRRREMGIRVALGALPSEVIRMVISQSARVTLPGLAAGLLVAVLGAEWLRGFLYGVEPGDLPTLTLMAALLLSVSVFSAWIPARHAARVDAASVLRCE